MRSAFALGSIAALAIAGCALDRSAILDRPAPSDASVLPGDAGADPIDAPVIDDDAGAEVDAFVETVDAHVPPDTFVSPYDAGPPDGGCAPRCEGSTLIPCTGPAPIDCASAGASCGSGPFGTPACVGGACGGGPICSGDGTTALACPGGVPAAPMPCERGCSAGQCRPMAACGRATDGEITPGGTLRLDLCGAGNDHDHDDRWTSGPCQYSADGEDRLIRLTLDRPGTIRLEVEDVAGGERVDPVVYVRAACEDRDSELGCDDDVSGSDYDSRLDVDLMAGEYFVVVDSVDMSPSGTDCGEVDLIVTRR